jgi:histidinol-phosphate aminotransferase
MTTSPYWSTVVRGLVPYVPGEQVSGAGITKLNTNENSYPPSPLAVQAMHDAIGQDGEALRLYPDPTGRVLREAVAQQYRVLPEQVFVGNGSDEVLAHVFLGLLKHEGKALLFPDVTYAFYKVYCAMYGIAYRTVAVDAQLQVQWRDYVQRDAAAIIVANPNAPTGHALAVPEIEALLQACPEKMVVIDEAYVDFGAESAVALVAQYPNLLVVHSLSKSRSLAGLRVGYAIGQVPLIEALLRLKDSFNSYPVDRVALAGAAAALCDTAHFEATRLGVMQTRESFARALEGLGFDVLPSKTNFLFVQHPQHAGAALVAALRSAGVLVRRFDAPTRIANFVRISVGSEAQCAQVVQVLAAFLKRVV